MLSKRVNDIKGDTKALYKLMANLTGSTSLNPMPPGKFDTELADEFTGYFLQKISKIHELFQGTPAYNSEKGDIPQLRRFTPMTESEVHKIINSMQSKSCELDVMPTPVLKILMRKCL